MKMTRRQAEVAAFAAPVFLAQGFARTTMGDIAMAAGVSRQGLYLTFANKDEAFAAAVAVLDDQLHERLEAGVIDCDGLEARLNYVCEGWLAVVFDLQLANPDARDMDDLAFPIVRRVYERFVGLVGRLVDEASGGKLRQSDVVDLARAVVFGIRGFSATATDGADLRRLSALQVALVTAAVERAAGVRRRAVRA